MAWPWDLAVALAFAGLMHLMGRGAGRPGAALPAPVRQVLGLAALGLAVQGALFVGLPPQPAVPLERVRPHPLLAPLLLVPGTLGAALWARGAARAWRRGCRPAPPPAAEAAGKLALGVLTLAALAPPARIDEALYHLALPLQALQAGRWPLIPGHANCGFPNLGEALFAAALAAGSWSAARALPVAAVALATAALRATLPARLGRCAWAATGLWLGVPVVLWQLPAAYVDVLEAVWSLTGVACVQRGLGGHPAAASEDRRARRSWLAAGAFSLGSAAACKALALGQLPLAALALLVAGRGGGCRPRPKGALGAALALLVLPSLPWLARNLAWFGSPLYPFATELWGPVAGGLRPSQREVLSQFMAMHGPQGPEGPLYGWRALTRLPWALLAEARFGAPAFDGAVGPLPLMAALAAVAVGGRAAPRRLRLGGWRAAIWPMWSGWRLLVWLSTTWQARLLVAPLWWAALVLAAALRGRARRSARIVTLAGLGLGVMVHREAWPAFDRRMWGAPTARQALREAAWPGSALCARAAAEQPSRLMLVWTQRFTLWCAAAPLWSDSYDEAASLVAWLQAGPAAAHAELARHHISHLLVDEAALALVPPGAAAEEVQALAVTAAAWDGLRRRGLIPLARAGPLVLYAARELPVGANLAAAGETP